MRRRHTLPVVALLVTALLGLAGCGAPAKSSQPALSRTTRAAGDQPAHEHDHGQAPASPPVAPRNGVLDVRVGKVTTIRFTAPQAGTYAFWCKYHLQMMQGKVTVQS